LIYFFVVFRFVLFGFCICSGELLITCITPPSRTGGVDSLTVDVSFNQQQFTSSAVVLSYFDPDDVLAASEWNLFFYAAGVLGGVTLLFMCGALMWRFCQLRRLQVFDFNRSMHCKTKFSSIFKWCLSGERCCGVDRIASGRHDRS
jgi:hypothetical protein